MSLNTTKSIYSCWTCGKSLLSLGRERPDSCFFWCTDEHKNEYEAKITASLKAGYDSHEPKTQKATEATRLASVSLAQENISSPQKGSEAFREKVTKRNSQRIRSIRDASKTAPDKGKRTYTCGLCGSTGHNARSCKKAR